MYIDISPPSGRSFTKHLEPRLPPSRDPNPTHPLSFPTAWPTLRRSTAPSTGEPGASIAPWRRFWCGVGWGVLMAFKQLFKTWLLSRDTYNDLSSSLHNWVVQSLFKLYISRVWVTAHFIAQWADCVEKLLGFPNTRRKSMQKIAPAWLFCCWPFRDGEFTWPEIKGEFVTSNDRE